MVPAAFSFIWPLCRHIHWMEFPIPMSGSPQKWSRLSTLTTTNAPADQLTCSMVRPSVNSMLPKNAFDFSMSRFYPVTTKLYFLFPRLQFDKRMELLFPGLMIREKSLSKGQPLQRYSCSGSYQV